MSRIAYHFSLACVVANELVLCFVRMELRIEEQRMERPLAIALSWRSTASSEGNRLVCPLRSLSLAFCLLLFIMMVEVENENYE